MSDAADSRETKNPAKFHTQSWNKTIESSKISAPLKGYIYQFCLWLPAQWLVEGWNGLWEDRSWK